MGKIPPKFVIIYMIMLTTNNKLTLTIYM